MKFLPLVFLVVLTVLAYVHGRAIHRLRRSSSYYANETDESSSEVVTQDGFRDDPVPATILPSSIAPDVERKDQEHVHQDKEEHVHRNKEEELVHHTRAEARDESDVTRTSEPKSEVVTTARPSHFEKDQQQEQPEEQQQSNKGEQKPSKRSEPTTSVASVDLSSQETSLAESSSRATEEPESSTRQESDDSDRKIEAVTEPKKEGRSGSDEPKIVVTTSVPGEHSSVSPQEPEKDSKDRLEESVPKDRPSLSHFGHSSGHPSASIEKRHFPGEHRESASESSKIEKDSVTEFATESTTSSKREEYEYKGTSASGISSEEPKDGQVEVVVVSTTPKAGILEAREVSDEESDEKKEADSGLKQQDPTSQGPSEEDQKDRTTTAPSSSPIEETKQSEDESTLPAKSRPSKRFADRVDYIPRDFQA